MNPDDTIISVSNLATRIVPNTDRFKPSHRSTFFDLSSSLEMMMVNEGKSDTSSKQASASHAGDSTLPLLPARLMQMLNSMRNTLEVKDHEFRSKMYSTCFTAACAIDWLLINGFVDSGSEGINLCQELLDSQQIVALTSVGNVFHVSSLQLCYMQDTDDLFAFKADQQINRPLTSSEAATWGFASHVKTNSYPLPYGVGPLHLHRDSLHPKGLPPRGGDQHAQHQTTRSTPHRAATADFLPPPLSRARGVEGTQAHRPAR